MLLTQVKMLLLAFISIGFFLLSLTAYAKKDTYVIGVEQLDYYPEYTYLKGEYGGYSRAVFDRFSLYSGLQFIFEPRPVARLHEEFLTGRFLDFKYPSNPLWNIKGKTDVMLSYSDAIVRARDGVMVLPQRKGLGLDQLKRIGAVRSFTLPQYQQRINEGKLTILSSNDFVSLLDMVLHGRVQGAYTNIRVARYQLEYVLKRPGDLVFDPSLPFMEVDYSLATIHHPKLIKQFNQFLHDERETLRELRESFGLKN